jgi:hypothetical protein
MGQQDRDYMHDRSRERELGHSPKTTNSQQQPAIKLPTFKNGTHDSEYTSIPTWAFVVCGIAALIVVLWIGQH